MITMVMRTADVSVLEKRKHICISFISSYCQLRCWLSLAFAFFCPTPNSHCSSQQHHSESSPLWDCFCTNIQKGEGWSKKTGIINFEWQTLDVQEDVPCTPCWVSLNPNHSLLSNLISAVWLLEAQSRVKEDVSEVVNGLSESYFAVSLVQGIAFIE